MELIKRTTNASKETMDTGYDTSYNIQYSYNSDGRFVIRISDCTDNTDTLVVLSKRETDILFQFVKKIKGVDT